MAGRKVLIIDDDPRNIFALTATLRSRKYESLSASGAEDGIRLLDSEAGIGIVLLDMMMADMDGYQAIPRIRAKHQVPIIAVTAQAMLGDREKCLEAGADEYISKPIDVDRLLLLLEAHLK